MRPVAVTFDYWNTLFAEPVPGGAADARLRRFRAWLRDRGSEHPDELVLEAHESAYRVHWEAWRAGTQFGSPGAVNHVLAELRLELTTAERSELQALFEDPDPELRLRPLEGVGEALERLRSAGVGLGVVCDAGFMPGRVLRRHLLSEGLGGFFEPDALAFSDEVGVYKPHPDIFRAALRALGAEPVEAVHVGDLKVTDVAGARRVGMASIRYTGSNDDAGEEGPEADAVISHHRDLPGVLGLACARRGRSRVTSRSEAAWRRGAGRAPTSPGS